MSQPSDRREFLAASLATGAVLATDSLGNVIEDSSTGLPMRPLGKTGVKVSLICLGGWHIGSVKDQAEAVKIMHTAIDEGLTFFDNAWDYHDGGSEEVMGKALGVPGKRDKVFLMTKNCARDAKGTRQHLEDSLRRMRTDHLDLWQFHEINYDNDPDWIVEKGALAEALKAQKEGKVRFIGFTGHKDPHIHLKMLKVHPWATVQMPINVCDYHYRSFIKNVLPEASKLGYGCIGMKSLAGGAGGKGRLPTEGVCTVAEAHSFSLSQEISSLVIGIDSMEVLKQDIAHARAFKPLSAEGRHEAPGKGKGRRWRWAT